MYANFRAVRSLVLKSLNEDRLAFAWDSFCSSGRAATPEEYAAYELSFPGYFLAALRSKVSPGAEVGIDFGCPLVRLFRDDQMSWDLSDPIRESYFVNLSLGDSGGKVHVSLRGGITEEDRLRAFVQALAIKRAAEGHLASRRARRQKLDRDTVGDVLTEARSICEAAGDQKSSPWAKFHRQLKKAGWDVDRWYIRDQNWRADLCDQLQSQVS